MFRKKLPPTLAVACLLAIAPLDLAAAPPRPQRVDFTRDIQPLLASRCYDCHGKDKAKGGLRLTSRQFALAGGESGEPVLVAGESARSALIQRVTTQDENDVMPQKGDRLTAAEVDLLRRWIDEGAEWPDERKHWAYVKPVRPGVPPVGPAAFAPRNAIDHFVLARLEHERLAASPETDRARWLRRVSLDLIGLPPTPGELAAFLSDQSDGAYERVVDRLLASPHYGERWARPWLDLARYADSHGFQRDDLREIWPYRDWVIRAMNADMPFDQFTIWQIAGDLIAERGGKTAEGAGPSAKGTAQSVQRAAGHKLGNDSNRDPLRTRNSELKTQNSAGPNPKLETRNPKPETPDLDPLIATGFHRAAPTNVEAGTDQEEGRVNQVFDRVNTTAAVWLGSTLECAQCHNHKYDPFSQKEYYQLFAFFNNTPRETDFTTPKAMASLKFTGPYLELPDRGNDARREALRQRIAELDTKVAEASERLLPEIAAWELRAATSLDALAQTHPLDVADFESSGGSVHRILPDKSVLLVDEAPDRDTYTITVHTNLTGITGFKLEALTDPSLPGNGPGRGDAERPNFVLNNFRITAAPAGAAPEPVRFVKATASFSQPRFSVENLLKADNDNRTGWAIGTQFHREHWATFVTEKPLGSESGTTFTFTLVQNLGAGRTIGRLRLSALTGDIGGEALPADVAAILNIPRAKRSNAQVAKLTEYFLSEDKAIGALKQARLKAAQELAAVKGPQTLVMRELERPRATTVLNRGNFLDPGEPVSPGTPAALHALRVAQPARLSASELAGETRALPGVTDVPPNRLDLARWLVSPENPLVARVTVNRWWAEFFGRGIVSTVEDFGVKGEPPTHPELLDWLAVEFMEHGWSMKHIHKLIALSGTYRQSSRVTPELLARDDQNKLYARGPRFRLDAETIRDNALAASGLLNLELGGPPVRPYQPPGLWENKVGGDRVTYEVSAGGDAWRRGIYTVWKRSSPYPSFINFDATARIACTVKRSRSNTPLQALTLLNDPVYVEAALALARRVLTERPDASATERIRYAFQLCLAREPSAQEVSALTRLLEEQAAAYRGAPHPLPAGLGATKPPAQVSPDEFSGWHAVTTALLNLDEMITKG